MANVVIVDVPVTFHDDEVTKMGMSNFDYPDNPLPGEVVGTLFNVPNGAVPEVTPERYFAVEGSETTGWRVVVRNPLRNNQPVTLIVIAERERLVAGLNLYEDVLLLSPVTGEFLVSPLDGYFMKSPLTLEPSVPTTPRPSQRRVFWANPFWQRTIFWSNTG